MESVNELNRKLEAFYNTYPEAEFLMLKITTAPRINMSYKSQYIACVKKDTYVSEIGILHIINYKNPKEGAALGDVINVELFESYDAINSANDIALDNVISKLNDIRYELKRANDRKESYDL